MDPAESLYRAMKSLVLMNIMGNMSTEQYHHTYVIRILGKLKLELTTWFPELAVMEDTPETTLLSGELPDQAALIGILLRAHNLNLKILSFHIQNIDISKVDEVSPY